MTSSKVGSWFSISKSSLMLGAFMARSGTASMIMVRSDCCWNCETKPHLCSATSLLSMESMVKVTKRNIGLSSGPTTHSNSHDAWMSCSSTLICPSPVNLLSTCVCLSFCPLTKKFPSPQIFDESLTSRLNFKVDESDASRVSISDMSISTSAVLLGKNHSGIGFSCHSGAAGVRSLRSSSSASVL